MHAPIEEKLAKYFSMTSEALKKVKISPELGKESIKSAEDLLDISMRYYSDARFFEKKGDLVNAYGAVCYAHAFLDAGARLGLFDVGKDSRLFMVD
jgi:hypothetical protein